MTRNVDPWSTTGVVVGLLSAAAAGAAALLLAVLGQGLGALAGGCAWIGISTPLNHPVWALVNEPTMDFATLPSAFGYWWGSLLLPLLLAGLTVPLVPRPRTVAAELAAVQLAWMANVIGVAWLPLLDPRDGHLARWLDLAKLPSGALWLAPAAAALLTVPLVLRLLALARAARSDLGRMRRFVLVVVQMMLPALAWVVVAAPLAGRFPIEAVAGVALSVAVALVVAWSGYPAAFAFRLEELSAGSVLRLLVAAMAAWALVLACGRPLRDGNVAGVLWGAPGALNNVRPWISPTELAGRGNNARARGNIEAIAVRGTTTRGPGKGPEA